MPTLRARVNDLAGMLPAERAKSLEQTLARYEQETGHQLAVLTVPSLDGEPIEPFALRVAERWKLGRADADDGALLVIARDERRARIEVGYGLEGAIPDAIAKRVIDEILVPQFRAGDYAGGVDAAMAALMKAARGESIGPPARPRAEQGPDALPLVLFISLFTSVLWMPFRGGRLRPLGALLGGATAAGVTWLFLRVALWSAVAFALGFAFGWIGPGAGRRGGRGGPVVWGPGGGWSGGGWGRGGGGGFGGGGGGFGGGGASGSW